MAKRGSRHKEKVIAHAEERLRKDRVRNKPRPEMIKLYKRFFKIENERIKMLHRNGAGGIEVARRRADLLDIVIQNLFHMDLEDLPDSVKAKNKKSPYPFTLVAVGGYGRGTLNPGSDVDLLFLCPGNSSSLCKEVVQVISDIQLVLYDIGLQVGHSTRSIKETIQQASHDHPTLTAMLDARFIVGDEALFEELATKFRKDCIQGREAAYLKVRREDFLARHEKYDKTVYLQEPNIKEGCGGLRDYQNTIWILQVKYGVTDLHYLVEQKALSKSAYNALQKAFDFLMRVRNELHWAERPATNLLTLRLQGVVAEGLGYPQDTILRKIEAFMRDYYRHTRAMYLHSTSIMQSFRLLMEEEQTGRVSFLARRNHKEEHFDGLITRDRLIYPEHRNIFVEDPNRMMRLFLHLQQRHLRLSPQIRKLIKANYSLLDTAFRYGAAQRDTFEAILSDKGNVARPMRQMHRVGLLGKYLPEFGELECLVQHEFFHRYTADEHTLKTLDALDDLSESEDPKLEFLQKLYHELEDPYILYLALILHDTGRAENYRYHTDASLMLTQRVCRRLQIRGDRRARLLFLVDNHLTLWRTATTRNLEDPNVIEEFAGMMQNRSNLETLLLMTYADSKGTNSEAWSSWKETLMLQLYANTCAYLDDTEAFGQRVDNAKAKLLEAVIPKMAPDFKPEIEAHFEQMPENYFFFRDDQSVVRHIELFRRFIANTLSAVPEEGLRPAVNWVPFPNGGFTQMELCCWDRSNLLVKVAGALAANRVNILSADIFTRNDNLALDVFRVCTTDLEPVTRKRTKDAVEDLLVEVLEPEADQKGIKEQIQIPVPKPRQNPVNNPLAPTFPSRALIANDMNPRYTVLEIQTLDRLGLLFDVFRAIAEVDVQIVHARISTEKGAAIDSFYLTDAKGKKVTDKQTLANMRASVETAISPDLGEDA